MFGHDRKINLPNDLQCFALLNAYKDEFVINVDLKSS